MAEELPNEFDLIVVGTGLIESIIAAAASRVGKTVLHLDPNDFYGAHWASFNLESIQSLPEYPELKACSIDNNVIKINSDGRIRLGNMSRKWSQEAVQPIEGLEPGNPNFGTSPKDLALKEFRKFNIDITPKLLFARGELVQLLVSSNICRYAEFRSVDRVLTIMDDQQLRTVPCTRADVFSSADVTNVERRLLMKHTLSCINFAEDSDEFRPYADKTFSEYLTDKRLTPKLKHLVLVAIAMANEETPCFDGVRSVQAFLESAGKYGDTPFLFPMYGCGEIPQCFCRLCAVFGGVYCLKRTISEIQFTEDNEGKRFDAIVCGGQKIQSKNIVFGHGTTDGVDFGKPVSADFENKSAKCGNLSRGILLTDRPFGDAIMNSGGGGVMFLQLPASSTSEQKGGASVIQLAHYSGSCPNYWYLIHITCQSSTTALSPEEDLAPYVAQLMGHFGKAKAPVIWSMYFNIPACQPCSGFPESPYPGVHLSCGPSFELDYDMSIKKAKSIFTTLYPTDEFLPRAPDPDEIIIGGDEYNPDEQTGDDE